MQQRLRWFEMLARLARAKVQSDLRKEGRMLTVMTLSYIVLWPVLERCLQSTKQVFSEKGQG